METRLPLEQPRADTEEEPARKRDLTGVAAAKAVMAPMFAATVAIAAAMAPGDSAAAAAAARRGLRGGIGDGRRKRWILVGADRGESEKE